MRRRVAVAMIAVALAGCAAAPSVREAPSSAPTSTSSDPATAAPVTAAAALGPFFAAAREVDGRLRHAAQLVNGEIGTPRQFSQATIAAVAASSPDAAAALLPAGMPRGLLSAVLTVENDLTSRFWAFRGVVVPQGEADDGYLPRCLANGAQPATRFAADLATAEALAEATPPFVVASPDSRAAAELAIYLGVIAGTNSGCMSCGGGELGRLPDIVWQRDDSAPGGPTDGQAGGIAFRATYAPSTGWKVSFNAC